MVVKRTYGGDLLQPFQVDHFRHAWVRQRLPHHLRDKAVQEVLRVDKLAESSVNSLERVKGAHGGVV